MAAQRAADFAAATQVVVAQVVVAQAVEASAAPGAQQMMGTALEAAA